MANKFRIEGKHVVLSNFLKEDISYQCISWLNDPEVVQYSSQRFIKHDFLSFQDYYESFEGTNNLFISIKLAKSNQMIGTMTAYFSPRHRSERFTHNTVDVGIMIGDKSKWGRGYGKDAWNTLLLWLEEEVNIRKITAGTLAINVGMIKLFEDSGMLLEEVTKDHEIVDNKTVDVCYFYKLNNKYK